MTDKAKDGQDVSKKATTNQPDPQAAAKTEGQGLSSGTTAPDKTPKPDVAKETKPDPDAGKKSAPPTEPPARTVEQGLATGNHPDLDKVNQAQQQATKQGNN